MAELRKLVDSVTRQIQWVDVGKGLLLGIAGNLLVSTFFEGNSYLPPVIGAIGVVISWYFTKAFTNKRPEAIKLIHRHSGETEYSLDLFYKTDPNIAEQMQLDRIAGREVSFPFGKLYQGLTGYLMVLLLALAIHYGWPLRNKSSMAWEVKGKSGPSNSPRRPGAAPVFQSASLTVTPPAYTGLPSKKSEDLNVSAITGSGVQWKVQFDRAENVTVRLVNSSGEEVELRRLKDAFTHSDRISGSGLYSFKGYWKDSLIYQSDFYKLEALPDLPPRIEPVSRELYQYHFLKDPKTVQVAAKISDDFRVKQVFIVATLARGSGENVKFREVKIPLTPSDFKEAQIRKAIDLNALHFTPGDELYYYWAAIDNREPEANFSKSDTYFIVYKDTARVADAELATMAVNMMPEYFRSQRQIIIDTEKLIGQRKMLKNKDFNATSNEIGFDQKVLRLRYGQYLGEEFETSIGGADNPAGPGDNGSIIDAFTHHSDGKGEGAEEHAAEPAHAHGHAQEPVGEKDPLAALMEQYTHAHDDAETNTFYEQSTRSLLKMALEQMWQSELHLRIYEPEKALPFEHKALEYLKTAQQKARTYVKKSGYDPPPIKEKEKRLTGELKELATRWDSERQYDSQRMDQLAGALLGFLEKEKATAEDLHSMKALTTEIVQRMTESEPFNGGLQNWDTIAALQKIAAGRLLTAPQTAALKRDLYKRTHAAMRGRPSWSGEKKLEAAFRKALK